MWRLATVSLVFGLAVTSCVADDEATASSTLQKIVEQSAKQFAEAFEQRDADALAELFTEEAEYVDSSGMIFHGQTAIGLEFAAAFEINPPGIMTIELLSIRPIAEGVMIEDGVSSFTPEGGGPISQTCYTATHVKQGEGTWLIASIRELNAGQMTAHGRLRSLSWLIGDWHEDVAGNVIATEWKWSDDGNFLMSEFSIRQSAEISWTGTHRVGWDAERNQFRSWIFESNGGAMEGWWRSNEDGSWSVSLSGVDAEGVRRSSTLTYLGDGEDALVVSQSQRIVGGESLPAVVHRVVRQPPAVEVSTLQR